MQTAFHIRTATYSDSAAVCELLRSAILQSCIQDHKNDPEILDSWLGNKSVDTIGIWLMSPSNHAVVAELHEKIVGIALLTGKGKIALFYVAPGLQGLGIGSGLLSALEEKAAMWGLTMLQIASTSTAQSFFQQQHFRVQGEAMSCFGIQTSLLEKRIKAKPNAVVHGRPSKCKCAAQT
jgi:GNAT superfamily N-acetyltransferase